MLPEWNILGVLPPIRPGVLGDNADRAPFEATLDYMVKRFGCTHERLTILRGLLDYRQELRDIGIVEGFQWIDGSFMENIEATEFRPPNDIDVVTFFYLPKGLDQQSFANQHRNLFIPSEIKTRFHVDGYPFVLGDPTASHIVKGIAYWYSMWSHRRSGQWKGFAQIKLEMNDDDNARLTLAQIQQEGVQL